MATVNNTGSDRLTTKGQRSRQRIIYAAVSMIRAQGFAETTIQDICAEVGIGVGTFYHYFRSKEEVLLAFIDAENQDLLEFYFRQEKSSYSKAILAAANHYLDMYFYKGPSLVSHLYSMMLFSKLDFGEANENALFQVLRDAFIQGQKSGEFTTRIDADFFVNMAMGEWFFFTSLWCNDPENFKIREMMNEHYEKMLKLVAATNP